MTEYVWPAGEDGKYLHDLHCREDRCCFGCGCPCHTGTSMRLTLAQWLAGQLRRLKRRLP